MRKIYLFAVLFAAAAIPAQAQSTTNTNCQASGNQVNCRSNTIGSADSTTNTNCNANGNQINCTSNTLGDSTNDVAEAERQREMYQSSQAAGAAIGSVILKHRINGFCKKNPRGWIQPQGYSRIECSDWNAIHQKSVSGSSRPVPASFALQSTALTADEIYAVEMYEGLSKTDKDYVRLFCTGNPKGAALLPRSKVDAGLSAEHALDCAAWDSAMSKRPSLR